ncbi:sensor histidine kinase [Rhizobium sp. LjRoot30]|uniref:sensor histidine kinase n=1 Tax=Rhizobium sp. LjRoot30 TaxID=3342320 RepID=UPI003ECE4D62
MAVVTAALLPALGMLAYNEVALRDQRNAELHVQAAQAARQAASEVDRIIDGMRSLLIAASSIPAVLDLEPEGCGQALKRASERLVSIRTILVIDPAGKLICDSIGTAAGMDFSDRQYFRDALTAPDIVIGGYTMSRLSDAAILPVAMPIRDNGVVIAVIATGIRLEWLEERIRERGLLAGGALTLADRDGIIIARNPAPERFVGTAIPAAYRYLVDEKAPGTIELVSQDGTERIIGYEPASVNTPLYVSAGISTEEAFASINRATIAGIALIAAGSLVAFLSAVVIGDRFILSPIGQIVGVLSRWRGGDTTARTKMEGQHSELGIVGAALDQLLDDLDEQRQKASAAEQRRALLAQELSHRVKNTLAIIQAIARQTFRSSDKQEYLSFSERVQALSGAYDALLSDRQEAADINDVVERALRPHQSAQLAVRADGPNLQLIPQCAVAMSLVVHELATNAVKYGALSVPEGRVDVTWGFEDDRIVFDWKERDGPAVVAPDREGFGSKLVRNAFPAVCNPETDFQFAGAGLNFTLRLARQAAARSES